MLNVQLAEKECLMKHTKVVYQSDFEVIAGNARSQAAVMVLQRGDKEGGSGNRHKGADQWLYVSAGTGEATVSGKQYKLQPGTLLLIEHGEIHEIHNNGSGPLETLNFYVPPAFAEDEEPLPAGES
jgi:mannose-6-phosphate isomerase-like protein (cupin superfamily)